jgi:uncharacterized protein (DUF1697 family)
MSDRRIALLRGINVGTAKRIAMADLRQLFERLGYEDVRTLLNSGNVVFTATQKPAGDEGARIEREIAKSLGVSTRVTIVKGRELAASLEANPLRSVADNPSRMLFMVLEDAKTAARLEPLAKERWSPEGLAVKGRVAYLWFADGIIDSRVWAAVSKVVKDSGTARNLSTMTKLLALAAGPTATPRGPAKKR